MSEPSGPAATSCERAGKGFRARRPHAARNATNLGAGQQTEDYAGCAANYGARVNIRYLSALLQLRQYDLGAECTGGCD